MPSPFTPSERERYARHILLKEIGGPGQQALGRATIALVGVGGLGAPAALYLAAAGVGTLRLLDDDAVSLSNLQRQILYRTSEVGAPKVESAQHALNALNPHVNIETHAVRLTEPPRFPPPFTGEVSVSESELTEGADDAPPSDRCAITSPVNGGGNALALFAGADIILDGSDSFETRFAVNAACHQLGITLISGAVGRWDGQIATFKSGLTKHLPAAQRLPCYQCFVPEAPPAAEKCAEVGIVGALTGIIGAMMALEAIKEVATAGESLAGRLLIFDGLSAQARTLKLPRDPACPICASP